MAEQKNAPNNAEVDTQAGTLKYKVIEIQRSN